MNKLGTVTAMAQRRPYIVRAAQKRQRNRRTGEVREVPGWEVVCARSFRCLAFRQDRGEADTIAHESAKRWRGEANG